MKHKVEVGCRWSQPHGSPLSPKYWVEGCGKKLADGDEDYCPKHRVISDGAQLEIERKMQKLRERKAFKAEMREALKESPLRGHNPLFDSKAPYSR